MDSVHHPEGRKWLAARPVHLNTHFEHFSQEVKRAQERGRQGVPKVRTISTGFP